jgi:hypothetical protein
MKIDDLQPLHKDGVTCFAYWCIYPFNISEKSIKSSKEEVQL